ncbi:MAG: IclR family transcriptional regulator [Firmicutes bacterium]|nr:IclR family transcriptional regulator [Bacillota bacterium]
MATQSTKEKLVDSTVSKALVVLQAVADHVKTTHKGISLRELAKTTKFNISTVYRYLACLESYGLIRQNSVDGMYELGFKVVELSNIFLEAQDLRKIALPIMEELCQVTKETIYLGILEGLEVAYLERVNSPLPIRPHTQIGGRNELYCTGLGKAILAFAPEKLMEEVIRRGLRHHTPNTIIDVEQLRREIAKTRARGYSIDDMENEEQVRCAGAPIYDNTGRVIGALSISGPAFRISLERITSDLGEKVKGAAVRISEQLGYLPNLTSLTPLAGAASKA